MSTAEDSGNTLSHDEILKRLEPATPEEKKLYIVPMVNMEKQIGQGSIDLRLGTDFITTKRTNYSMLDPVADYEEIRSKIHSYQERLYVDIGRKLVLHPNQIVLGCTLEYLRLPADVLAYVVGRSSWGRLGLVIATATLVHPGYTGIITLEMVNLGDTPIALYPGTRIAQIVLHKIASTKLKEEEYLGKMSYSLSTRPSFSKIYDDEEMKIIRKLIKKQDSPFQL